MIYFFARTSRLLQLLSLFSYARRVTVDRGRRLVTVNSRWLWFISREKTIAFERVHYIDYGFSSLGTSWGLTGGGFGRTDQVEKYPIQLILRDPDQRLALFSFKGEGAVETGWAGVLLGGDSVVDLHGDQEDASRSYTRLLREYLGVPVGKPIAPLTDAQGVSYKCAVCGRPAPATRVKCLYCGGDVQPETT